MLFSEKFSRLWMVRPRLSLRKGLAMDQTLLIEDHKNLIRLGRQGTSDNSSLFVNKLFELFLLGWAKIWKCLELLFQAVESNDLMSNRWGLEVLVKISRSQKFILFLGSWVWFKSQKAFQWLWGEFWSLRKEFGKRVSGRNLLPQRPSEILRHLLV